MLSVRMRSFACWGVSPTVRFSWARKDGATKHSQAAPAKRDKYPRPTLMNGTILANPRTILYIRTTGSDRFFSFSYPGRGRVGAARSLSLQARRRQMGRYEKQHGICRNVEIKIHQTVDEQPAAGHQPGKVQGGPK